MKNPNTSYADLIRFVMDLADQAYWGELEEEAANDISFSDHKMWGDELIERARELTGVREPKK